MTSRITHSNLNTIFINRIHTTRSAHTYSNIVYQRITRCTTCLPDNCRYYNPIVNSSQSNNHLHNNSSNYSNNVHYRYFHRSSKLFSLPIDPTQFSSSSQALNEIGDISNNNVFAHIPDDLYNGSLACIELNDRGMLCKCRIIYIYITVVMLTVIVLCDVYIVTGEMVDIELTRQNIAAEFNLHMRDVRFLDSTLRNLPSILARDQVILVNLEMFKAIISRKKTLIFDHW